MGSFRLDRYLLRLFAYHLALVLAAMLVLYLAVDLVEKLRWIHRPGASSGALALFFWYRIPLALSQLLPLASLFSGILTVTGLNRQGELIALRAAGIAPARALAPLLVGGAAAGAALWCTTECWLPVAQNRLTALQQVLLDRPNNHAASPGRWFRDANRFIRVGNAPRPGHLRDLEVLEPGPAGALRLHLLAPEAFWRDNHWVAPHAELWTASSGSVLHYEAVQGYALPLPQNDVIFELEDCPPEALTSSLLATRLEAARDAGLETRGLATAIELRSLLPFSCFLLVLLGTPLGCRQGRQGSVPLAIAGSLALGLAYLASIAAALLTAYQGLLPVSTALWVTQGLWLGAGVLLWRRLR